MAVRSQVRARGHRWAGDDTLTCAWAASRKCAFWEGCVQAEVAHIREERLIES